MANVKWCKINFNKWNKDEPDCFVRSLCAGTGLDYEIVCKMLGVQCIPGRGFTNSFGLDLDDIHDKMSNFFKGEVEDEIPDFETDDQDPLSSIINSSKGPPLRIWLAAKQDKKIYGSWLVYMDDFKSTDGGHIVFCQSLLGKAFFVDTWNPGSLLVVASLELDPKKHLKKTDPKHWKREDVHV